MLFILCHLSELLYLVHPSSIYTSALLHLFYFFIQNERLKYQMDYMDSIKKLEDKWMMNQQTSNNGKSRADNDDRCLEKTCSREVGFKPSTSLDFIISRRILLQHLVLRNF